MTEAKTRKKAHAAPHRKGHPASQHARSHKSVRHSSVKTTKRKAHKHGRKVSRYHGQRQIDSARASQIQAALIRANYMQGTPSGKWDQATKDAMARFQADNGWQTKTLPDSRALIKLGLGPSRDHLLNPETAMTARPESVGGGGPKEAEFSSPSSKPALDSVSDPVVPPGVADPSNPQPVAAPVMHHPSASAASQQEHVLPAAPH